jgi:hypothetical protein
LALTPEQQDRLNKLTAEQIKLKKRNNELSAEEEAYLDSIIEKKRRTLDSEKEALALSQQLLEKYQAEAKTLQDRLTIRQQIQQVERDYQSLLEVQLKSNQISLEEYRKQTQESEKQIIKQQQAIDLTDKFIAGQKESVDQATKLGEEFGKSLNAFKGGLDIAGKMGQIFKGMQSMRYGGQGFLGFLSAGALGILSSFLNAVINLAIGLVDMENAFMKATGASREFAAEVTTTYRALDEYAVSMDEAREVHTDLFNNFTDFNMTVMPEQRAQLALTTATLVNYGVASADLTKGLQIQSKAFGLTGIALEEANRDLFTFAQEIGVAPAQMASDFAAAGESLAKFGEDGIDTFKELARVAKITGMEIGKLKQMTDVADTFEGAATTAAKLNAAIGGNMVNAMDLMMETDPTARFEMMTGALKDAGLQFNDMSYYQRIFYAQAMGLKDVNELALVMSGRQDLLAGSTMKTAEEQQALAENSAKVQSFMEQLQAVLAENADELLALIGGGEGLMQFLRDLPGIIEKVVTWTRRLAIVFALIAGLQMFLIPLGWMRAAAQRAAVINTANATASTAANTQAQMANSQTMLTNQQAMLAQMQAQNANTASTGTNTAAKGANTAAAGTNAAAQGAQVGPTAAAGAAADNSTASNHALATAERNAGAAATQNAGAQTAQAGATAGAGNASAAAAPKVGFMAKATWKGVFAILAIGLAVVGVIWALTELVKAFSDLGDNAWPAAVGLIAVGLAIAFIMKTVAAMVATGVGAVAGLLIMGIILAVAALVMAFSLAQTFIDAGSSGWVAAAGILAVGVALYLILAGLSMLVGTGVGAIAGAIFIGILASMAALAIGIGYIIEGMARFYEAIVQLGQMEGNLDKLDTFLTSLGDVMSGALTADSATAVLGLSMLYTQLQLIASISFDNTLSQLSEIAGHLAGIDSSFGNIAELGDLDLENASDQIGIIVDTINRTTEDEAVAFTNAMVALQGAVVAATAEAPAPRGKGKGSKVNEGEEAATTVTIEKIEITLSQREQRK